MTIVPGSFKVIGGRKTQRKFEFWILSKVQKKETMSASDQNSKMPFLRNEFSKIFEDLFTVTLFTKMIHFYDQTKNLELKLKTWIWSL